MKKYMEEITKLIKEAESKGIDINLLMKENIDENVFLIEHGFMEIIRVLKESIE